jgi:hypothetical protein
MSYPKADNLQAFMIGAGIPAADSLDYENVLSAVIKQWELDINYSPFISPIEDSARTYWVRDGGFIGLGGLVSLTSVTSGSVLIEDQDYKAYPENATAKSLPITHLIMSNGYAGLKITVTGTWGFCSVCPEDVRLAILSKAASILSARASDSNSTLSGAVQSIQQGEVKIQYAAITTTKAEYSAQQIQFNNLYEDAVKRYRRLVI